MQPGKYDIMKNMIGYVKGKIIRKNKESVVVDAGGVGYEVFVAENTLEKAEVGGEEEFFIWTYLRQDTLELYGCLGPEELDFFKFLTKISGIGPKIALTLARFGSPEKLKKEIEEKGSTFTKEVKGLGSKKMKQLLLELTGKVKELEKGYISEREEAVKALANLGFPKEQAKEAVLKVSKDVEEPEEVVEKALKMLGKNEEKD